jgi:hypothetical protein
MRPQIRSLDDLLRQFDHQLIVKNRELMSVRRGGGAPRRARPYGGRKWCFRCQRRGLGGLNSPSRRTSSPSSRIRRHRRGCCRAFRGSEEGARPGLRGEKCNESAGQPRGARHAPRISAHCPPGHPVSGLINQKLAIGDRDLGRDPSLEAPLGHQDADRGGPQTTPGTRRLGKSSNLRSSLGDAGGLQGRRIQ